MKVNKLMSVVVVAAAMVFAACNPKGNGNEIEIQSTVPEVAATEGAYTVVWNAVNYSECNGLVFAGNYNDWNIEPANMVAFEKIDGYDNWYKAVITPTATIEQLEGKPCALAADGSFPSDWKHQWIGSAEKPCEVVKGEVEFAVEYDTETKMIVKQAGTVVYVRSYQFKVDPCEVIPEYDVTFNLAVAQAVPADAKVYVVGAFVENSWSLDAYEMTRTDDTHFTATVKATIGCDYKYTANASWDNEMVPAAPAEGKDCSDKLEGNLSVADVTVNDNIYGFNGINATICKDEDPQPEQPVKSIVKVKIPATWAEPISCWMWWEGENGKFVTPEKEGDWYVVTPDSAVMNLGVIYVQGTSWDDKVAQTEDIKTSAEKACYQLEMAEGAEKATATAIDCE